MYKGRIHKRIYIRFTFYSSFSLSLSLSVSIAKYIHAKRNAHIVTHTDSMFLTIYNKFITSYNFHMLESE